MSPCLIIPDMILIAHTRPVCERNIKPHPWIPGLCFAARNDNETGK